MSDCLLQHFNSRYSQQYGGKYGRHLRKWRDICGPSEQHLRSRRGNAQNLSWRSASVPKNSAQTVKPGPGSRGREVERHEAGSSGGTVPI